jgi:hypothetical protein
MAGQLRHMGGQRPTAVSHCTYSCSAGVGAMALQGQRAKCSEDARGCNIVRINRVGMPSGDAHAPCVHLGRPECQVVPGRPAWVPGDQVHGQRLATWGVWDRWAGEGGGSLPAWQLPASVASSLLGLYLCLALCGSPQWLSQACHCGTCKPIHSFASVAVFVA